MPSPRSAEPALPELSALGRDLLITTPAQRRLALARPFLGLLAYALAASIEWWWLTPLLVFLIFVAVVTVTHDVVHGSLGLTPRQTEWALFVLGAVLLESGHAYRLTHAQHHRVFPAPDDPEGDPARMTFRQAVLHGCTRGAKCNFFLTKHKKTLMLAGCVSDAFSRVCPCD